MTASISLLVADDSEIDLEILTQSLAVAFPDAQVRTVTDALCVADLCLRQKFDCVILDYQMERLDGLTLARHIRASAAYLPIILVTGARDDMLAAEALRSGVSDYIAKPRVTVDALRRAVGRVMRDASQAQLIDEQRRELETFAYALAHDFKQPIRQIITFSKMLSDEIGGSTKAVVQQHLRFLSQATTRLDKLVDVMTQYTLLNQPPLLADFNLASVAASVKAALSPLLAERRGEFVWSGPAARLRGNKTLMFQVLQNLVANGLHYNRHATPRVEVSARIEDEFCVIDVSDNGIGIAAEYLLEIFKPLTRLHSSAEYPGSGLGLTLARKAVVAQKGEIWCESTPGGGSVFHIRVPRAARSRPVAGRAAKSAK